jgi:hypothetical protein
MQLVDSPLRRLQKAHMKQPRIPLLRRHPLIKHQRQQKAIGIPQHRKLIAALGINLKTKNRTEELLKLRNDASSPSA